MVEVISRVEVPIACEDDVVVVRRRVRVLAGQRQLDSFAVAAVTTATSELVRNVYVHAGGGVAILEELSDGTRFGLRATFIDEGPGIDDLERALRGGYSTAHTMGLGLSGSRRLVDRFEIETTPGKGTCVKIEKWAPF
jgi:serine/threonine-protein kinase RsbT